MGLLKFNASRYWVPVGRAITYNPTDLYRHTASNVDRILRGAKPAALPIEQPTRLTLVVNLKTAKAHGIRIPASILLRADKVIE